MKTKQMTYELAKELFNYNPVTGVLYWKKSTNRRIKIGAIAGCLNSEGYLHVRFNGVLYRNHRVIWLWMTGEWPKDQIDHINGIKDDNRWYNLREATRRQNSHNRKLPINNTSGCKGVTWQKDCNLWRVRIGLNGKRIDIGLYHNIEDAIKARHEAELKYFGEFAPGSKK